MYTKDAVKTTTHARAFPVETNSFESFEARTFLSIGDARMDSPSPMDIDPVDDGPRETVQGMVPMTGSTVSPTLGPPAAGPIHEISKEEEARQAIEMLRGDDVAQRVAAASRLVDVATVLGPQRSREVREE